MAGMDAAVVVIGAGASGVYAAKKLVEAGIKDVLVVEASDYVGGRIRELHGFSSWPIQLGPEFIHGKDNSMLMDELTAMGAKFTELGWPAHMWFPGQSKVLSADELEKDEELEKVHELFVEELEDIPRPSTDINALQLMQQRGMSRRQIDLAEACYANDFGCSLKELGLKEMITENVAWCHGESYLHPDIPYPEFMRRAAEGLRILTKWPVRKVEMVGAAPMGHLVLHGDGGRQLKCKRAIVTASLGVLKSGAIQFSPPLPLDKRAAISRLGYGNAIKVLVAFKDRLWPKDVYDIVCPGAFVPEMWALETPAWEKFSEKKPPAGPRHVMVCFFAGDGARKAQSMPEAELVAKCVEQITEMFCKPGSPKPVVVDHYVADWAKEEFVRGAYSYPTYGAEDGDREAYARPVNNLLFFAGEATHPGINPCIHAAMETGVRAAFQAAASLATVQSRL